MVSYCSFSQSLKPIVQKLNNDTLFCFNLSQSRELAKLLVSGAYNDSIAQSLSKESKRLYTVLDNKERQINNLNLKVTFTNQIVENQKENLRSLEGYLEQRDKKLKRVKRQRKWMLVGLAGLTIFSVTR